MISISPQVIQFAQLLIGIAVVIAFVISIADA